MEYYKELFFKKKKHSYNLREINFHIENQNDVVKYENIPSKGFKLINSNFLDPVTGYIFHPLNSTAFKEKLIQRNLLINGVCIKPIIFEYIKNGFFLVHIYDDVKDDLEEVCVSKKVSLSESKPGNILRNIDDESYYIYLGLIGQYYVSTKGKASVKKKHLVLKTDLFDNSDEDTVLTVHHFNYVDYTKDTDKKYVVVKSTDVENLKIHCYHFGKTIIPLGKYINNTKFIVYDFQNDYPTLLLSKTVKKVFSNDDISLTRNKVELNYEYLGETSLELIYNVNYTNTVSSENALLNASLMTSIISSNPNIHTDFEKYNYAAEIDGEMFLLSPRMLFEVDCYESYFDNSVTAFKGMYNTHLNLYKVKEFFGQEPIIESPYFRFKSEKPRLSFDKDVKLYKIKYVLNGNKSYNLFNKPFENHKKIEKLVVSNKHIFEHLKTKKAISVTILGKGAIKNVCFV